MSGGEERRYGRDQVSAAANQGAETVIDEFNLNERDADLVNLAVNAALTSLDKPGATFDDIVHCCYGVSPDEVREWCRSW